MKRLSILALLVLTATTGCGAFWEGARTANDIAAEACAVHFAQRQGITVREAAKAFCDAQEVVDIFAAAQGDAADEAAGVLGLSDK